MINFHKTLNHPTTNNQNLKEVVVRNSLTYQCIAKKENNLEVTNRIGLPQTSSEPIHIKTGKPLRVILPKHTQNSQKKPQEYASIDCILVEMKEKTQVQQNESHAQKIGTKMKQKLNCLLQQSQQTSNKDDSHFASTSVSNFQSPVDYQNFFEFRDWVSSEILKINQKIKVQDERLELVNKLSERMEQKQVFSGPQMQELNRILALVEKAGNREDYKRTNRMIQQLRSNILELHQELSQLSEKSCKQPSYNVQAVQKIIKKNEQYQCSFDNINKMLQNYKNQDQSLKNIETKLINLQKDLQNLANKQEVILGHKKFEGQMITLSYFQKIRVESRVQEKISNPIEQKQPLQKKSQEIDIFSNVYYLDTDGYLLDSQGYYLLTKKQQKIKLTNREMDLLKTHKIL